MTDFFFSSKPQIISESALKISQKIFGDLETTKTLVVGENKISFLICDLINENGGKGFLKLTTQSEKQNFLDEIIKYLENYDIIITSFKSDKILIKKEEIKKGLKKRKQKPIFLIDTNIPGNLDLDISHIDNCFLFDLNDLEQYFDEKNLIQNTSILKIDNDEVYDMLDTLLPLIFKNLDLKGNSTIIFEERLKSFFKLNKNNSEKLGVIKFLKQLLR